MESRHTMFASQGRPLINASFFPSSYCFQLPEILQPIYTATGGGYGPSVA